MDLDFDPLFGIDKNNDGMVTETEIKVHELEGGHGFDSLDLNHDNIFDQFQNDLNHNVTPDMKDVDFNFNNVLDNYEHHFHDSKIMRDFNNDDLISHSDQIIGRYLFRNG